MNRRRGVVVIVVGRSDPNSRRSAFANIGYGETGDYEHDYDDDLSQFAN